MMEPRLENGTGRPRRREMVGTRSIWEIDGYTVCKENTAFVPARPQDNYNKYIYESKTL